MLQTPKISKTTQVSTDPLKHSEIKMNVDIWFPNAPCWLVEIQVATGINTIDEEELQKMLEWTHVEATNPNKVIQSFTSTEQVGPFDAIANQGEEEIYMLLKNFVAKGHMCRVRGSIEMSKVTANVIFRLKGQDESVLRFWTEDEANVDKLQLNHFVNKVTFGEEAH